MKDVKILLGTTTVHIDASRLFDLLSGRSRGFEGLTEDAKQARKSLLDNLQDFMGGECTHGWTPPLPPATKQEYRGDQSAPANAYVKATEALRLALKGHNRIDADSVAIATLTDRVGELENVKTESTRRVNILENVTEHRINAVIDRVVDLEQALAKLAPRFDRFMELISAEIKNPKRTRSLNSPSRDPDAKFVKKRK